MKIRDFNIQKGEKLASYIKPMLATLVKQPLNDPAWIAEIKLDGYRAIAEVNENQVRLYSRNGLSYNKAYPKIVEALKEISLPCVLDGEIVALNAQGKPTFNALQTYDPKGKTTILYYVFDCLELDGVNLEGLPLVNRKELLEQLIGDSEGLIKYSEHVTGDNSSVLFEQVVKLDLEGIIIKKANSKYVHQRSQYWLKYKNYKVEDYVIVGMLSGKGSRQYFGGLILAEKEGKKFHYIGHAGSGFTDKQLKETFDLLQPHIITKCPMVTTPHFESIPTWVTPKYYCCVRFTEITEGEEVLRHPVYQGIRFDKEV